MNTDTTAISNRLLATSLCAVIALSLVSWLVWPQPPHFAARSGSAFMMTLALIGSTALIGSAIAAIAKRGGRSARSYYRVHVWLAVFGFLLVAIHSKGSLTRPPALLLVALLGLLVLGFWARSYGALAMATTFGRKHAGFKVADPAQTDRLRQLILTKQQLLHEIDQNANEALFSLTPAHWIKSPRASFAYQRAVRQESKILGARNSVSPLQAYWRLVHQLLAVSFVAGLFIHIVLVLFFAGYVADGRDIYWWHLFAWDLF